MLDNETAKRVIEAAGEKVESVFITSDGSIFLDENSAKNHESELTKIQRKEAPAAVIELKVAEVVAQIEIENQLESGLDTEAKAKAEDKIKHRRKE